MVGGRAHRFGDGPYGKIGMTAPISSFHPRESTRSAGRLVVALAALLLPALSMAAPERVETLCEASETAYFSCTGNGVLTSVCASRNFTGKKGYIQLRMGRDGTIDVEVPSAGAAGRGVVKGQIITVGGSGAYMRFDTPASSYVVYSQSGKKGPKRGVGKLINGVIKTNTRCEGQSFSEIESAPVPVADVVAVSGT